MCPAAAGGGLTSLVAHLFARAQVSDAAFVDDLSRWLVKHQPITLAINAPRDDFALAQALFAQTGQVVYTVGSLENPALTCQARPQDGEVFGEFPVRGELGECTKFPVVVPTPTPAYNSTYTGTYLAERGAGWQGAGLPAQAAAVAKALACDATRGYVRELAEYLADACAANPKASHEGTGRTAFYGLQTTPQNGQLNFLRCGPAATLDDVAPHLFPFLCTSAWPQLRLSVDPANTALAAALDAAGVGDAVASEDAAAFEARVAAEAPYNVIDATPVDEFSLVGQFVSRLLCVGHIKSTEPAHQAFLDAFRTSPKWLQNRV